MPLDISKDAIKMMLQYSLHLFNLTFADNRPAFML